MFLRHAISTVVKNPCSGLKGYHTTYVVTIVESEHAATVFWVDVPEEICYLRMQSASLERKQ
jgi:hypothetical protein